MQKKIIAFYLLMLFLLLPTVQAVSKIKQAGSDSIMYSFVTTSQTFTPTQATTGMLNLKRADFDGIVETYLEIDAYQSFSGIPNGEGSGYYRLYDATNNQAIDDSLIYLVGGFGDAYGRLRSENFASYFDTYADINVFLQLQANNEDTTVAVQSWRIIWIQEGTISKTVTHIPIGSNQSVASGTYAEITYPKWWDFNALKYDGTIAVYFCATLTDNASADLMYAKLYDKTANANITGGELSTASNTEVFLCSGNIASNLTNGDRLTTYVKRGTTGTGIIRNAFLEIVQTDMNDITGKLQTIMQHTNRYRTKAGTYQMGFFIHEYNPTDWENATIDFKGEYILKTAGLEPIAYAHLTAEMVEISNSEKNTSSTSYVLLTTNSLTVPTSASDIDDGIKSQTGSTAYITSGRSIITINNLGTEVISAVKKKDLGSIQFINPFRLSLGKQLNIFEGIILLFRSMWLK